MNRRAFLVASTVGFAGLGPAVRAKPQAAKAAKAKSTILFSQAEDYCDSSQRHMLREISSTGTPSFSCELPGGDSYFGEGLLDKGRWVSAVHERNGGRQGVRAIALPGVELPEHGWATAWGSPARDAHSR